MFSKYGQRLESMEVLLLQNFVICGLERNHGHCYGLVAKATALNSFHATGPFLCSLKTRVFDVKLVQQVSVKAMCSIPSASVAQCRAYVIT